MGISELEGKYARLRQDLDEAYAAPFWNLGKIDRLTEEIAQTEQALAKRSSQRPPAGQLSFAIAR